MKHLILALTAALCFAVLAGCKSPEPEPPATQPQATKLPPGMKLGYQPPKK